LLFMALQRWTERTVKPMPCKYKKSCGLDMYFCGADCPEFVAKKPGEPFVGEEKTIKNRPSRTEIERKAIKAYGHKKQEDICIEEMSELIKAIIKNRRYSSTETRQSIREEIADVQIMLDQMKMIFGTTLIEEDAKLTRLAGNLGMLEVSE